MSRSDRRRDETGLALAAVVVVLFLAAGAKPPKQAEKETDDGSFSLSAPIACKEINGYADYVPLPDAALTCDEKLFVYFEPRHYKSARTGKTYQAHFTQEGRIRRRGDQSVIWSKPNILDYTVSSTSHPEPIYLMNKLALKQLKPGEYEYDIILHDAVGQSNAAVRSLPFTIIEAKTDTPKEDTPSP